MAPRGRPVANWARGNAPRNASAPLTRSRKFENASNHIFLSTRSVLWPKICQKCVFDTSPQTYPIRRLWRLYIGSSAPWALRSSPLVSPSQSLVSLRCFMAGYGPGPRTLLHPSVWTTYIMNINITIDDLYGVNLYEDSQWERLSCRHVDASGVDESEQSEQ